MKFKFVCAALFAALLVPPLAHAQERFMALDLNPADPPWGWLDFCKRYAPECNTQVLKPNRLVVPAPTFARLEQMNAVVNARILPLSDMQHWGVVDKWDYPDDGYGDCEDYALEKRRELLDKGWPRQMLLITYVLTKEGYGHAVLTLATAGGDYIIDNLRNQILLWSQTDYHFIGRQSETDPNVWKRIYNPMSLRLGPFVLNW